MANKREFQLVLDEVNRHGLVYQPGKCRCGISVSLEDFDDHIYEAIFDIGKQQGKKSSMSIEKTKRTKREKAALV